jgi:hypothetical protein
MHSFFSFFFFALIFAMFQTKQPTTTNREEERAWGEEEQDAHVRSLYKVMRKSKSNVSPNYFFMPSQKKIFSS